MRTMRQESLNEKLRPFKKMRSLGAASTLPTLYWDMDDEGAKPKAELYQVECVSHCRVFQMYIVVSCCYPHRSLTRDSR